MWLAIFILVFSTGIVQVMAARSISEASMRSSSRTRWPVQISSLIAAEVSSAKLPASNPCQSVTISAADSARLPGVLLFVSLATAVTGFSFKPQSRRFSDL